MNPGIPQEGCRVRRVSIGSGVTLRALRCLRSSGLALFLFAQCLISEDFHL